jgi:integrase/recombinase XerD
MSRFSSSIMIRKDAPRKDGRCLICLRVFIDGVRYIHPLDIAVMPEQFTDKQKCIVYDKSFGLSKTEIDNYNLIIEAARNKASSINTRYILRERPLTVELFKREFCQDHLRNSFIDFYIAKMAEIKGLQEKSTELTTYKVYDQTLKKLRDFKPLILFADLNLELVQKFDAYLKKNGLGINTRWKHHKNLKKFIKLAEKEYLITNPYNEFKVARAPGNITFLEEPELKKLFDLYDSKELPAHFQEVLARFLFSCFTGLRISDSNVISEDNIINDQLIFTPHKSRRYGKILKIHLNQTALSFVNTRIGKSFHVITDQRTNEYLKTIVAGVGIRKRVTFHVSRHTFATQFLLQGGKIEVLQKLLGHSKIETTMVYVHLVDQVRKQQIMLMDNLRIVKDQNSSSNAAS